jgi:hypothetical protein
LKALISKDEQDKWLTFKSVSFILRGIQMLISLENRPGE